MTIKAVKTRFRAYQLESAGSLFSYFSGVTFTLIEARLGETSKRNLLSELRICNKVYIDVLHITSWDRDHCSPKQLQEILTELKPKRIEYPGYKPETDAGRESLKIIKSYRLYKITSQIYKQSITPEYIESLNKANGYGYKDIVYWPKEIDSECANNNSTVKQFRSGCFNVLSLGDVESSDISSYIRRARTVNSEVDVMIMAHHGADNGFTTSSFLKIVKPTIAIVSSNYANQYQHPKQEIRDLLHKNEIKLFTTKTGDVVIESISTHKGRYKVTNLKANSTEVSSCYEFTARKNKFLRNNDDVIRNRVGRLNKGPKS